METSRYHIETLSNGLRVVCWQRPGLVSYIGVAVNAGSRDEDPSHEGLAHFVEHTIFKGTPTKKSWQITNRMESVGGELNAYTSKEETMIYTNAPAGYEDRALELLADLVTESSFPQHEIDLEKEVIIEEIHSYLDSPSERIYDEFEELAYARSCLSHNILGSPESVREISGKDCRKFLDKFYIPSDLVVYCAGPLETWHMVRKVSKYFGSIPEKADGHNRITPPPLVPFDEIRDRETHQANTIMGARVFGRDDQRRFPLFLLNNYLGGPCMNSRLNRELREKRGYVYAVDSCVSLLSDAGLMMIYFACDAKNVNKCRKLILREIDALCQKTLSATTFEKIKRQYCGQLLTSSDHIENRAMSLAKSILYYNRVNDISTTAERIMEVSAREFRESAELIAGNLSILTLT